tara:strand:- start:6 stop:722 length:717 start_codon:yes stop_codon:yes gene_type:complete
MKKFSELQEEIKKKVPPVIGLGGGGGGTDSITAKSSSKSVKKRVGDVAKVLTRPFHKKRVDPTEKFATESVGALAVKGGSKVVPALMTGIGAVGTIMQSRKKKDKKVPRDDQGMPDPLSNLGRKAKVTLKKGIKDFKKGLAAGQEVPRMGAKGRFSNPNAKLVKDMMKKRAKEGDSYAKRFIDNIKRNKNIDEEAITNNVGGGQIAGTIEAGDNPPVKKKKRYIYGGTGSRKMWMTKK